MVPVELSPKATVKGFKPLVVSAVKLARGSNAPTPWSPFVLLPSLPLTKTTALLNEPALGGLKRTTRLVEPKPARLKGVPERMVNGPPVTEAVPLLRAAPP